MQPTMMPPCCRCRCFASCLGELADKSSVAVINMTGSLCPITKGHVQMFEEARKIVLNQNPEVPRPEKLMNFEECIGLIKLNYDYHVRKKMADKGHQAIDYEERAHLVRLATVSTPWLAFDETHGSGYYVLRQAWPNLHFTWFAMNGADDVLNGKKYEWDFSPPHGTRMIIMGRPGFTEQVKQKLEDHGVNDHEGYCILGPELPDISSTAVRTGALQYLHPDVAQHLLDTQYQRVHKRGGELVNSAPEVVSEEAASSGSGDPQKRQRSEHSA